MRRLAALSAAQRTGSGHLDALCSVAPALLLDIGSRSRCSSLALLSCITGKAGGESAGASCLCGLAECAQQRLCRLGCQVLVVVVVDLDHGGVGARAQTFDFGKGEEAVLCGFAVVDAEVFLNGGHDAVRASQLAGGLVVLSVFFSDLWSSCGFSFAGFMSYGCAALNVVATDGIPVVHGVESGNLVDTHWGHLEEAGDLVHDADAGEAVLSLAEVEQGHDGGLFVLWRVSAQDFLHELLVDGIEFEGDVEVVVRGVAVLQVILSENKPIVSFCGLIGRVIHVQH